jgi:hypothetical protein
VPERLPPRKIGKSARRKSSTCGTNAERARDAAQRAYAEEVVEDLGVIAFHRNGSIQLRVGNAAEQKLAIKELRLKKKELAAQKRELTANIAAIRAQYRTKVAGRYSTVGLGRGTGGRIIRAGIQAKRRGERMQVDSAVVPIEHKRNAIDSQMILIDRAIARIEAESFRDPEP